MYWYIKIVVHQCIGTLFFPNAMYTIPIFPNYIEFGVKELSNGKAKDIKDYQDEIFKIGGSIC